MSPPPIAAPRRCATHYSRDDVESTYALHAALAAHPLSVNTLAGLAKCATTTVSKILRGTYPNAPGTMLARLRAAVEGARYLAPAAPALPPSGAAADQRAAASARILALLDRHSSQHPMLLGDLIAQVPGDESDAYRALDALMADRKVCAAHITRPSGAMVVVYPVGKLPGGKPSRKPGRGPAVVIPPKRQIQRSQHHG